MNRLINIIGCLLRVDIQTPTYAAEIRRVQQKKEQTIVEARDLFSWHCLL